MGEANAVERIVFPTHYNVAILDYEIAWDAVTF